MMEMVDESRPQMDDSVIEAFLDEIEAVCRKHGLSLAHEDFQGAFIVQLFSEENIGWLRDARREAKYQ